MADPRIKQMKIKTGVVKRVTKEVGYYEIEVGKELERYEKKQGDNADEYTLRKQQEVINESRAMIPDTKNRLRKAREDLAGLLESEKDLEATEEYKEAEKYVAEADLVLKKEEQEQQQ